MLAVLVLGLLVGEAGDELVVGASGGAIAGASLQLAQRRDLDQLGGDLAQPLLERALRDCQATPPSRSSCASPSSAP